MAPSAWPTTPTRWWQSITGSPRRQCSVMVRSASSIECGLSGWCSGDSSTANCGSSGRQVTCGRRIRRRWPRSWCSRRSTGGLPELRLGWGTRADADRARRAAGDGGRAGRPHCGRRPVSAHQAIPAHTPGPLSPSQACARFWRCCGFYLLRAQHGGSGEPWARSAERGRSSGSAAESGPPSPRRTGVRSPGSRGGYQRRGTPSHLRVTNPVRDQCGHRQDSEQNADQNGEHEGRYPAELVLKLPCRPDHLGRVPPGPPHAIGTRHDVC